MKPYALASVRARRCYMKSRREGMLPTGTQAPRINEAMARRLVLCEARGFHKSRKIGFIEKFEYRAEEFTIM